MRSRIFAVVAALVALACLVSVPAHAGCGCDKPPPALSAVRPAFASPGGKVTIFALGLLPGKTYSVRFDNSGNTTVQATAVLKRDFADGITKPLLEVRAPALPPGPTRIRVSGTRGQLLEVPRTAFTMLQAPLALSQVDGETLASCYRGAVGSDGTFYLPLDISAIADHMIFAGLGKNFPLLFDADDIAIYNTQGVLMQLLGPREASIFSIVDQGARNSRELVYDRHEFWTYRAQHLHERGFGLDPKDPAWHTDGTRHIDHDHLVLAIRGVLRNQGPPSPGATKPFDLSVVTTRADRRPTALTTTNIVWSTECRARDTNGNGNPNWGGGKK